MIAGESALSFTKGPRWTALEQAFATAAGVEGETVQIVSVIDSGGTAQLRSDGGAEPKEAAHHLQRKDSFAFADTEGVKVSLRLALKDVTSVQRVRGRVSTPGFKSLLASEAVQHGYRSSTLTGTQLQVRNCANEDISLLIIMTCWSCHPGSG